MFGSLRTKLIAAFALIIFLSLFLASSAFVLLLRDYQTQLAVNQLADLALPLSYQVAVLERAGADPEQIGSLLEDQAADVNVRVLLVSPEGMVLGDSAGSLNGQQMQPKLGRVAMGVRVAYTGMYRTPDGQELFLVAPEPRAVRLITERFAARPPSYTVILAVPHGTISSGWRQIAPMLSFAGAISLGVSIVVAYFMARSISGPIAQITRASEQMARGNYDQHIDAAGRDEIGQLAHTFNLMAREVALSHRTLKDFLANVSHELKTPLTSIQGFSQAMIDGTLQRPEEYAEAGRIIGEEGERMARLVDDLMSLSRLESGQVRMERRPLDLAELLRVAVRRMQWRAEERGVDLRLDVADLPRIQGDNHWLEQVFANLLDNALRYTPTGGAITVTASPEGVEGGTGTSRSLASRGVCVRVHNTGSYIPEEDLPRVFERFYQVDKSRSNGTSGLGLAVVREVAQAHGGSVEAASDRESGTSFTVRLPV